MGRDPRYDILFEPVEIGPVTSKNRFYQVPHCNGMGHLRPRTLAEMRRIKAEGGWGVVCTEQVDIQPDSDGSPWAEGRLWDDDDLPALEMMAEAVHGEGALAGIELGHNGVYARNLYSRMPPLGPRHGVGPFFGPTQFRAMDREDIRRLRKAHRDAALRSKRAGFDIVYVYAAHDLALPMHFLSRRYNDRGDEYGGSLENRARLLRELIEDTKGAVGDTCAVAVRLAVDELLGPDGITCEAEGREVVELLADLPDLWDVLVSDWGNDSATARFEPEGHQEPYVCFVKQVTGKPVVGVGRFTSPDTMAAQVRNGILDFVGAARPSIADPFLPKKIEEGRLEEIRECIGCNICVATSMEFVPIRCTQNPTMGEEWRRGWHPERIQAKTSDDPVLVVGAGPAGLECALQLANRGYDVTLSEATASLGGRVTLESQLPGLSSWSRVRDYRQHLLQQKPNVEIYLESALTAEHILEYEFPHVFVATGSSWRRDGRGRSNPRAILGTDKVLVHTPDDIMADDKPEGPVVVFDDDHYYMASVIAEMLGGEGQAVTYVTPATEVASWTRNTLEQVRIHRRLLERNVKIVCGHNIAGFDRGEVRLRCIYSGITTTNACASAVLVTERVPNDNLYRELSCHGDRSRLQGLETLRRIGDCVAPGIVAAAVHSGHWAAGVFRKNSPPRSPSSERSWDAGDRICRTCGTTDLRSIFGHSRNLT